MKYAYTAVLTPEKNSAYSVRFPDLLGCFTCGDDLPNAILMAQDALCLWLYDMEQDRATIPLPRNPNEVTTKEGEFTSIVSVDTDSYRRFYENKSVKKTLTIPMWLNEQAELANINFSKTLQVALKNQLHISD